MYHNKLVYKADRHLSVFWVILWKDKEALTREVRHIVLGMQYGMQCIKYGKHDAQCIGSLCTRDKKNDKNH